MSNVLYLVHRIPFPPDKGDKIRSYHLLKFLSQHHTVYMGAFVDDATDFRYLPDVQNYCAEVCLRPIGGWRSRLLSLLALLTGKSLSLGHYADKAMAAWVDKVTGSMQIDAVVVFSSTMALYLPKAAPTVSVIADFVDVDSDKWRQYAAEARCPMSWLYQYEARALANWEADVLGRVDAVGVVSAAEGEIVPGRTAANEAKIQVMPNGVDYAYFDPGITLDDPYEGNRSVVVFTGAMDYYANEDGVSWFVDSVWPMILRACPDAEFFIVGSKPTNRVRKLADAEGVTVTGRVEDIRPYLRHARVSVAPLRLARGVQNKVLEALSMGLPVVATSQALRGLHGTLPATATEAMTPEEFCREVSAALKNAESSDSGAGRQYIVENYDWQRNLMALGQWLLPQRERKMQASK